MIIINEDCNYKKRKPQITTPYKGRIVNNILVIEDVFDGSRKANYAHRCVVKCLNCGKVREVPAIYVRSTDRLRCNCNKYKKSGFRNKRGKMLRFLSSERNKAYNEMLFEDDIKRVEGYDNIINFLKSFDLNDYFVDRDAWE